MSECIPAGETFQVSVGMSRYEDNIELTRNPINTSLAYTRPLN